MKRFSKIVAGIAMIALILLSACHSPYRLVTLYEEYEWEPGLTMAYMDLQLPHFRGRKYAPLMEAITELHYDAKMQYNVILGDALKDADKDPVFARLVRYVIATSKVDIKNDTVIVEVTVETYDGAASATHGFTRVFTYDVQKGNVDIRDINEH